MHNLLIGWPKLLSRLLLVGFVGMGGACAYAGGLTPQDEKQILAVVRSQLDAFAQDDAAKAFSYAAPNIQRMMGTPQHFMEMVRNQYEVVYRPASATFLKPTGVANEAVLKVQLTDGGGDPWIAIYTLQKQKSKLWRITGCSVTPASNLMV